MGQKRKTHVHATEEWTKKVKRGGLKQIGDMTYGVFESMELEIRRFFKRDPSQSRQSYR